MSAPRDVAVIVGSLRKGSFTRRMTLALPQVAPDTIRLDLAHDDLPRLRTIAA